MIVLLMMIGLGAGLLGGLLGISGGIITVPCLVYLFRYYGFASVEILQLAIGTSLASMVFNAAAAMYAHHSVGAVNWKIVKRMLPGLVLGCLVGAFIGQILPSALLEIIFGFFALIIGYHFYRNKGLQHLGEGTTPKASMLNGLGFGVGAISNILGIGGGTMTVPLFARLKVPLKSAVGTSTATGFIITLLGSATYLILGAGETFYPMTIGFIYIPAFIVLAITTSLTAPIGAKLAHRLKTNHLKKVFAVCLMIVGLLMVIQI